MKRAHTGDFAQGYFRMVCSALKSKAFLFSAADHQSVCMGYFYPKASVGGATGWGSSPPLQCLSSTHCTEQPAAPASESICIRSSCPLCSQWLVGLAQMPLWRELRQGTQWVVLRCIKGLCKTLQFLKVCTAPRHSRLGASWGAWPTSMYLGRHA